MEKDKLWYLKRFNLFETMGMDEMESISKMVAESEISKKQHVYMEGDPSENL